MPRSLRAQPQDVGPGRSVQKAAAVFAFSCVPACWRDREQFTLDWEEVDSSTRGGTIHRRVLDDRFGEARRDADSRPPSLTRSSIWSSKRLSRSDSATGREVVDLDAV